MSTIEDGAKAALNSEHLSPQEPSTPPVQRCVVVARQPDGFGLTVTGNHPVYVHTVKADGAAFRAGVRQGDKIIKVNGMPVTASNHLEVIRMISGGQTVALTLSGKPPNSTEDDLTESREDWKRKQVAIISQMLEQERRHVESLRESCMEGIQLERALQRIEGLQVQLKNVEALSQGRSTVNIGTNPMQNMDILSMEDETDDECDTLSSVESQGPFSNLQELITRPAHMAAFINYLLANANPSSFFFYLITEAYQSSTANAKDLRRWAYELFSTFLIPNAPLSWNSIEQSMIQSIDKILVSTSQANESDIDQLLKIFVNARQKSIEDINDHLADFRQKREIGLGSLFDANQLAHISKGDQAMERRIGETILIRSLENLLNSINYDMETCDSRSLAIISALATVIKVVFNVRSNTSEKILDRCPTFLTKDKGGVFKMKVPTKRSVQIKGHQFVLNPVNLTIYCYQCRDAVWGVNAQAFFCQNCDVVVHKQCTSSLTDHCYPATQKKTTSSKVKKIVSSNKSDNEPIDGVAECSHAPQSTVIIGSHEKVTSCERPTKENVKSTSSDSGIGTDFEKPVSRSHSMRMKIEDIRESQRGQFSIPWGGPLVSTLESDERSRRSRGDMDSDENVLPISRTPVDLTSLSGSSSVSHTSIGEEEVRIMFEKLDKSALTDGDSDLEVETEVPPLESFVGWDVIKHLKPKEKRRQEVINELFHTERTHVRNLKVLYYVFYKPMLVQNVVSPDLVKLFFSNIDEVLEIHSDMSRKMRAAVDLWRKDGSLNGLFGDIGKFVESLFDGEIGQKLLKATCIFCQHQQHALDILRQRSKKEKDDQLSRFLAEAESNLLCRKLQLKDMLPVEMQRLVKYPLLLETIAKYTVEPSDEQTSILNSVNLSKKILFAVNTAKRNAENFRRLEELQKRLVISGVEREQPDAEYSALNLTNYKLVHDGPLTWRLNRGKMIEVHVILLEDIIMLLTKTGDGQKLVLKSQEQSKDSRWSPVLPLASLIVKEKANDKRALFIVNTIELGAQIYELLASTATERKTWYKLLSDQIEVTKRENILNADHDSYDLPVKTGEYTPYRGDDSDDSDQVQVSTHPRLVHASEITIEQPTILEHARPILTPAERLRRSDDIITKALLDKLVILAEFLPGSKKGNVTDLEKIRDELNGLEAGELKQRDGQEVAMSAIVHANRLLDAINQGMNTHKLVRNQKGGDSFSPSKTEEDLPSVPCYKLTSIAAPLMNHLKALMQVIQEQKSEMNCLRQQLNHYKEIAENGPGYRTVSEETLTEGSALTDKVLYIDPQTDKVRRMQKKDLQSTIPYSKQTDIMQKSDLTDS